MSHQEDGNDDKGGFDGWAAKRLDMIEHLTGSRPPTCPWRALYAPLVQEVLAAMTFDENGNLGAALGDDPPGILIEGIAAFKSALAATRLEDMKLREAERKARAS